MTYPKNLEFQGDTLYSCSRFINPEAQYTKAVLRRQPDTQSYITQQWTFRGEIKSTVGEPRPHPTPAAGDRRVGRMAVPHPAPLGCDSQASSSRVPWSVRVTVS